MIMNVMTPRKCGVRGCYRYQCKEVEAKGYTLCYVHLPEKIKTVVYERKKKDEKMKEDERFNREVARIRKQEKKELEVERKQLKRSNAKKAKEKARLKKEKKKHHSWTQ